MKYEPHWSHPLILAVAICAVDFAIEGPKLLRTKAASAAPEGDHYKDLRAGIKDLGDMAFASMKETAESAIKIADALNREVTAQAQKREVLEAAVERLGYWPSYSGSNGAVRCELVAVRAAPQSWSTALTTNGITITNSINSTNLFWTTDVVEVFMQGQLLCTLSNVVAVLPAHDTNEPLCTLVRYLSNGKTNEFHAWMSEVRDSASGKVLAAGPTPKQWAEVEKLVEKAVVGVETNTYSVNGLTYQQHNLSTNDLDWILHHGTEQQKQDAIEKATGWKVMEDGLFHAPSKDGLFHGVEDKEVK